MTEQTAETVEIPTYRIPVWNLPVLETRVAKLSKRAIKLGCEPLTITIHEEEMVDDPKIPAMVRSDMKAKNLTIPQIKICVVTIDGATPKLAGWKFVGTLDHYSLPGKVIVNTVPGERVPQEFHTGDPLCGHCNKIRRRKETFVVENEEGETLQVGRQCIKDFLGHNPAQLIGWLQALYELTGELDDEENERFHGGRAEYYYDLTQILTTTAAVIRNHGWTPRSAETMERQATSGRVSYVVNRPWSAKEVPAWEEYIAELKICDDDNKEALDSIEWLTTQEDNNEYMHNLKMIGEAGQLTPRLLGYACSIVSAFQRAADKLAYEKSEAKLKLNEHFPSEIKSRIGVNVEIVKIRLIDGQWGTVRLLNMRDEDGRTLTWFANADPDVVKGGKYRIVGTIKKFDEYNEWKQTILTRVKITDELADDWTVQTA
jgi:hypothetical protein